MTMDSLAEEINDPNVSNPTGTTTGKNQDLFVFPISCFYATAFAFICF